LMEVATFGGIVMNPTANNPNITTAGFNFSAGRTAAKPLKRQSGVNPSVYSLWDSVTSQYPSVGNWGIWGDKAHQMRQSDHNTGDAIDIATVDNNGQEVADYIISQARSNNVKYVIHNRRIWKPSTGWKPYKGSHAHDEHVHVSFVRGQSPQPMLADSE
jgi:hypothetical protein